MAATGFDDSVEKLLDFCNLLGQTSAVVTAETEVLEARGGSLERTEAETRKRCEQVADRLGTALDELTEAHEDACDHADRLTEAAQDLASSRLSATEESLDSAESSFEQRARQEEADLEKTILDLFDAGFQPLAAALDEIEAQLARGEESAKQALEELEQGAGEAASRADQERAETATAIDEAERAVAEEGAGALERDMAEHASFWGEELPEAVRAECLSVGEPLEALYREWEAEVVAEGDELSEAVAGLLEDAADIVTNQAGEPLATAVAGTADETLAALRGRQEVLLPTLADGEPASDDAAALVDELAIARVVVGEIDRLLKALAE
jgi:hypothetical protein